MSFFTLPPEINSLRMFIGAGTTPMLQAATAWDGLAEELAAAANSFASVTSGLAGQAWQGAASTAMMNAAAPYAGWLSAAASQAGGAAGQARIVASLFEAAQQATVLPQAIDANRNSFVQLVMSNLFGQNAPLIAMAEGIYEEMWAADVSAMAGYYSGAASVAAQVVPWASVLQSLPALGGGAMGSSAGAGTVANPSVAGGLGAGGGGAGGGAAGNDSGGAAAGGGGGGAANAGSGMYTNGAAGAATDPAAGTGYMQGDPGSAAPQASHGVAGGTAVAGAGGMGFMPVPIPGAGSTRAGLLGDTFVPPAKDKPAAEEAETPAAEAEQPAPEVEATVPQMGVLPTTAPDVAAKAAPAVGAKVTQAAGSAIPASKLRGSGASESAAEAEEEPVTLRPKAAKGKLRPEEEKEKEEAPKVQIRGG